MMLLDRTDSDNLIKRPKLTTLLATRRDRRIARPSRGRFHKTLRYT